METFWLDFLTKQMPVIVVLGIALYVDRKYFTEAIIKKDEIIEAKEEEIRDLNKKLLELTKNFLTAFNKNTDVLDDIRDLIKNK